MFLIFPAFFNETGLCFYDTSSAICRSKLTRCTIFNVLEHTAVLYIEKAWQIHYTQAAEHQHQISSLDIK